MEGRTEPIGEGASVREDAALNSEQLTELRAEVMALRTRMEEQIVRAERDALVVETDRLAATEREGAAARGAASAVPTTGPGAPTGTSSLSLFRPLTQARPPKFDNVPEHYAMWRSKFGAYISSLGHLHVLTATVPVMVGDISVSQEELTNR
ncbi:unnamed protein product, partial [Laminaria digitata]